MVLCDFFWSTIAHNGERLPGEPGHRQASLLSGELVRRSPLGGPHIVHARRLSRLHAGRRSGGLETIEGARSRDQAGNAGRAVLAVMGAWTVLSRTTPPPVTRFRELVTLGTMLVMAFLVFAKQHR